MENPFNPRSEWPRLNRGKWLAIILVIVALTVIDHAADAVAWFVGSM